MLAWATMSPARFPTSLSSSGCVMRNSLSRVRCTRLRGHAILSFASRSRHAADNREPEGGQRSRKQGWRLLRPARAPVQSLSPDRAGGLLSVSARYSGARATALHDHIRHGAAEVVVVIGTFLLAEGRAHAAVHVEDDCLHGAAGMNP